ncbi:hypothetical protein FLP41_07895 [Paracoccus marcusii]|uniref:hypothetical protein n=1 Tax=Paracoccus marcusii TaxID=59779 RepID=UPI002ED58DC2|nr:hypothetical protein FLP41_07895 [Paracoccus marcusii]
MLSAARGLTLIYSGGRPVPALTDGYRWIGTGDIAGIRCRSSCSAWSSRCRISC